MSTQRPTVGCVVHYYHTDNDVEGKCPNAALVTHIWAAGCVNLEVSPNGYHIQPGQRDAVDGAVDRVRTSVPYSEEPKPGHWCWPPREPVERRVGMRTERCALNGEQIRAVHDLARDVGAGHLPVETAVALIELSVGWSREEAERVIKQGRFAPSKAAA